MYAELRLPDDWTPAFLHEVLGGGVHAGAAASLRVTFLDTFDWRLAAKGARLWLERTRARGELCWTGSRGATPCTLPFMGEIRWARDLPDGHLRSQLVGIVGVRALIAVGSARLERHSARIRDADGNDTLHLDVDHVHLQGASGSPSGAAAIWLARLRGVPGFEGAFERAFTTLTALGPSGDGAADLLALTVAAAGRSIGDYSSKLRLSLSPDQPSDEALRIVLRALSQTIRANVDGTIADIDTEFLHDLRVAVRRTRSALTQVKGTVADDQIAPFLDGFKWLGRVTGPCRDLDVFQQEIEAHRRTLTDIAEQLGPLHRIIQEDRLEAHTEVCTALGSDRFKALLARWESFLELPVPAGARGRNADVPILDLASARILKAYGRILRHGRSLGSDPPAEVLHRLRIDAKKLRYLLEFFSSLYPENKIEPLVKQLKSLQDILGGCNDVAVQQRRLVRSGHSLSSSRRDHTETLMAVDRLTSTLEDREQDLRRSFAEVFADFTGSRSQARYRSIFAPRT